jgi:hypothetical protein
VGAHNDKIHISDYLFMDEFVLRNSPKLEATKLDFVMVLEEQTHDK